MIRRSIAAALPAVLLAASCPAFAAAPAGNGKPQAAETASQPSERSERDASRTVPRRESRAAERTRPARNSINPFREQIEHTIARV